VDDCGSAVDSLLYDIGYKANGDSLAVDSIFFPLARYKSWYDGHSFASGLFPFGNGKSQESSSEAVNGYYGAYLWSLVKNQLGHGDASGDFKDFLRLLLATEIRGAKTYWHMLPPEPVQKVSHRSNRTRSTSTRNSTQLQQKKTMMIYNPSFRSNYMVGNLGMLDAVCNTYFAKELFYVHLINIIPVTAITTELFSQDYAREQYKNVIAKAQIPNAWKGYSVSNRAIADPAGAWEEAQSIVSIELDSGLSKSQVLFFISTLEGFEAPNATTSNDGAADDDEVPGEHGSSDSSAYCSDQPHCAGLLTGLCCPTGDGTMLACCQ
jgi:endo-1,3(4)-beta-glucanase